MTPVTLTELAHHLPLVTGSLITVSIVLAGNPTSFSRRMGWRLGLLSQIIFIALGVLINIPEFWAHAGPALAFARNLWFPNLFRRRHATTPPAH